MRRNAVAADSRESFPFPGIWTAETHVNRRNPIYRPPAPTAEAFPCAPKWIAVCGNNPANAVPVGKATHNVLFCNTLAKLHRGQPQNRQPKSLQFIPLRCRPKITVKKLEDFTPKIEKKRDF